MTAKECANDRVSLLCDLNRHYPSVKNVASIAKNID